MAIYHLTVKTISRTNGRSAVAAAAYRSGSRLLNERDGLAHDFRARSGVAATFIAAPDTAPAWALDRQSLWCKAELHEKRSNAVTAREWEAALPSELTTQQREALARQFAAALVERFGVVADCAIHAPSAEGDDRNHHLHLLMTTRTVEADGFGAKTRSLDDKKTGAVEAVRELWEELANAALEAAGSDARIDRRSLMAQAEEAAQRAAQLAQDAPTGMLAVFHEAEVQEAEEAAQALLREPQKHVGAAMTNKARREKREREEKEILRNFVRNELEHRTPQGLDLQAPDAQQLVNGIGRRALAVFRLVLRHYGSHQVMQLISSSDGLRGRVVKRLGFEPGASIGDYLREAVKNVQVRARVAYAVAAAEFEAGRAPNPLQDPVLKPAPLEAEKPVSTVSMPSSYSP